MPACQFRAVLAREEGGLTRPTLGKARHAQGGIDSRDGHVVVEAGLKSIGPSLPAREALQGGPVGVQRILRAGGPKPDAIHKHENDGHEQTCVGLGVIACRRRSIEQGGKRIQRRLVQRDAVNVDPHLVLHGAVDNLPH